MGRWLLTICEFSPSYETAWWQLLFLTGSINSATTCSWIFEAWQTGRRLAGVWANQEGCLLGPLEDVMQLWSVDQSCMASSSGYNQIPSCVFLSVWLSRRSRVYHRAYLFFYSSFITPLCTCCVLSFYSRQFKISKSLLYYLMTSI